MNKILILFLALFSSVSYSQITEGQKFCEESKDASFFPLQIDKKKILWGKTFYFETKNQTKILNGKTYIEFKQEWNKASTDLLYLREENGIIYQYDPCCKNETIRYNPQYKIGYTWKTVNNENEYKVVSYDGKLQTPYCEYQNLLVIKAKMKYGTFNFYYLKGHGYIGATQDEKLISCVSPEW